MRLPIAVALVSSVLLIAPSRAQSLADQKAEVDLETARVALGKAQADLYAALRTAATGSTSTVSTPDKAVEAAILRRAIYRLAAKRLADDVAGRIDHAPLLVQFGSSPPSLAAWFAFADSRKALEEEIAKVRKEWEAVRTSAPTGRLGTYLAFPAPAAFALLSGLSLLRTDSAITGAGIKATDEELAAALGQELPADLSPSLEAFDVSKDGASRADELLGGTVASAASLSGDLEQAKGAAKRADDALKALPAGAPAVEDAWTGRMRAAAADLATALADYQKLRAGLLSSTDGTTNAVLIHRQELLAAPGGYSPVLYVLSHDADLTSISRKNLLTGIGSTPVSLTGLATIDYVVLGRKGGADVRHRGTVSCLVRRAPFDRITMPDRPLGSCAGSGSDAF